MVPSILLCKGYLGSSGHPSGGGSLGGGGPISSSVPGTRSAVPKGTWRLGQPELRYEQRASDRIFGPLVLLHNTMGTARTGALQGLPCLVLGAEWTRLEHVKTLLFSVCECGTAVCITYGEGRIKIDYLKRFRKCTSGLTWAPQRGSKSNAGKDWAENGRMWVGVGANECRV
jgi:hypothetical protein